MNGLRLGLAAAAVSIIGVAAADQITVPNQFSAGTLARASEVNENFSALAVESNAQDARIATLETIIMTMMAEKEQMTCAGTVGTDLYNSLGWPGDPLTSFVCVMSEDPSTSIYYRPRDLFSEGWLIKTVSSSEARDTFGNRITQTLVVFERNKPAAE